MIRNKRFLRQIAVLLIFVMIQNCLFPAISYALTSGPHQPEFTSFESPGSTDMVNLITGDFTYSLPVIDVPGPEGNFSLPLSYHAGIALEQEASWVGLGFSLNAGAITRNIIQYPDDANGEILKTENNDPGGRGWNVNTIYFGNYGWDSEKGHGGNIGFGSILSAGYGSNKGDITALGATFKANGDIQANPVDVAMSVASIASSGLSAAGSEAAQGVGTVLDGFSNAYSLYSLGRSLSETNYTGVYNKVSVKSRNYIVYQKYKYWLDATRDEHMYGVLNLGKMNSQPGVQPTGSATEPPLDDPYAHPSLWNGAYGQGTSAISKVFSRTQNTEGTYVSEATSDIHMYIQDDDYYYGSSPISLAADMFSVMGNGISGSIQPYRLDVGSVAFPKTMEEAHYKYDVVPFKNYKVGFKYSGAKSNQYDYHLGSTYASEDLSNIEEYGLDYTQGSDGKFHLVLEDPSFYDPTKRTEGNRPGLNNDRLASGKWVEWYTNAEIASGSATAQGFVDFLPASERGVFRNGRPTSGIGGYSITREDGYTFHYALPIYNLRDLTYAGKESDPGKNSFVTKLQPYATTWLLTAITGPDYDDRAEKGVISEEDYGYWVKFEYGKFSSQYKWRTPYWKNAYAEDDLDTETYSTGYKETYYLNSISTRTHTALFIKSERKDGRGHYIRDSHLSPPDESVNDQFPSSSLKLEEIVLLAKSDYKNLTSDNGIEDGLPAFTKHSDQKNEILGNGDSFNDVIDRYDVLKDPRYDQFLKTKAIRRVLFNYSYNLCKKTTNSFESATNAPAASQDMYLNRSGKLTLESLSVFGAEDVKLMPDYVFTYGYNPDYHFEKWDGWGFYNRSGSRSLDAHLASQFDEDGAAWSLSGILTPLGTSIKPTYERDDYSSINGVNSIYLPITGFDNTTNEIFFDISTLGGKTLTNYLSNGQTIRIENLKAEQRHSCRDCCSGWYDEHPYDISSNQIVQNLTSNSFTISVPQTLDGYCRERVLGVCVSECETARWSKMEGGISPTISKKGGDIRVASVVVSAGINEYKTRYLYSKEGTPTGISSGVVSSEPIFSKKKEYDFYNLYDHPSTPVLYGKVTVLNGPLTNDDDYIAKNEFNYVTPHYSMIQSESSADYDELIRCRNYVNGVCFYYQFLERSDFYVNVDTDLIGQIKSINSFDRNNTLTRQTVFNYGETELGSFTEGSILTENYLRRANFKATYRIARTKKKYSSSILNSVLVIDNNLATSIGYGNFDFLTGEALETTSTNSFGVDVVSKKTPAYALDVNVAMGSKAYDIDNRNMLSQSKSNIVYKKSANGNMILDAGVQTWSNSFKTRYFEPSSGEYIDFVSQGAWRANESYQWNGKELNADGSFKSFIDFDHNQGSANDNWLKSAQVVLYDNFSRPLVVKDLNGNYVSSKYGYDGAVAIATAVNAQYGEMAFSGAEDKMPAGNEFHFGGEIRNAEKQTSTFRHTGNFSIRLFANESGFTFNSKIGVDLESNRKYKASVWIHKSDRPSGGGKLYAAVGSTVLGEVDINDPQAKQAGDWYLVNLVFDVPASFDQQTLTVGCKNAGLSEVYFDDFRFHPVDASFTSFVYDPSTLQITFALDHNNLYTRYEYDAGGRMVKAFKEVLSATSPEKIISATQYNFGRMQSAQWQDTGTIRCSTGTEGGFTGEQEKEQRDVNSLSSTYGEVRWVSIGTNAQSCPPCDGDDQKVINGICETGSRENLGSYQDGTSYVCHYRFLFSDGSFSAVYTETNDTPCVF